MVNIEKIWHLIMKADYALERTCAYSTIKSAAKQKAIREAELKEELVSYMRALREDGLLSENITSYEEYLKSAEIKDWIVKNAPKNYDFSKGYYDEGNPHSIERHERDFELQKKNVSPEYIKRYLRSSGYQNSKEAQECFSKLAKKFGVSEYTIGKFVDAHFRAERRAQFIYQYKKRKQEKAKQ